MIRVSQRRFDLALATFAAALVSVEILTSDAIDGPVAANLVVLISVAVALAWRRRHPLVPVVALAIGYPASALWLTDINQLSTTLVPALLTSYAVGRYAADVRLAALTLALAVAAINLASDEHVADDWVFPLLAFGAALLTGRALRTRALVAAQLAERTERLAAEQELLAAEAAIEERRRIARELHDVIAHTLSVMVVQAGGARRVVDRDTGLAIEALDTVEATGRSALVELRRMLGFVTEASGTDNAAPLEPAPTIGDLAALARRASAAGLPTTYALHGAPDAERPLPAGAEVAAFRIAQEALTNALKHAGPGARATLTARWTSDAFMLEICDDGAGQDARLPSGGHGLIGMRERVALYHGDLETGPAQRGGFRVAASLPLAVAVEVAA
ncbi:sensor histidine kinase [Baekduia sp. Peel2402]|uniref:sensor histidine kinase n=1 Tax=Baekduia sp. Peel2402 TaxID=3458296 RepID=UPI00403E8C91